MLRGTKWSDDHIDFTWDDGAGNRYNLEPTGSLMQARAYGHDNGDQMRGSHSTDLGDDTIYGDEGGGYDQRREREGLAIRRGRQRHDLRRRCG